MCIISGYGMVLNRFILIAFILTCFWSCGDKGSVKNNGVGKSVPVNLTAFPIKSLVGHKQYIFYLDYSPDYRFLASGSADNTVRIWDCNNWNALKTITEDYKEIWGIPLLFSRDQKYLVIGAYDTLKVLSVREDFKEIARVFDHKGGIQSLSISSDSKTILTAGVEGSLNIWTLPELKPVKSKQAHVKEIWSACISPDMKFAVSGGEDALIKVWSYPDLELKHTVKFHELPIEYVQFSHNGRMILAGSSDSTISVWDFGDFRKPRSVLRAHMGSVLVAVFSSDDNLILSGGSDDTIYVYSVWNGEIVYRIKEHLGDVMTLAVSPDGKTFASGSRDRTIKIWALTE